MVAFVKQLTLRVWWGAIAPHLVWKRMRGQEPVDRCSVFESSRMALAAARATGWLVGVAVEPLPRDFAHLRDEQGLKLPLRVIYQDLPNVQADIMAEPAFREAMSDGDAASRLPVYLAKTLTAINLSDHEALWRVLLVIQICAWHLRHDGTSGATAELFLWQRPWMSAIARYAAPCGIRTVPMPPPFSLQGWLRRRLSPKCKTWVRQVQARWRIHGLRFWRYRPERRVAGPTEPPRTPRVAVDYRGQLNLTRPERYSDLFFWQPSSWSGGDLSLCLNTPQDPLDQATRAQLSEFGIEPVVFHPQAAAIPAASMVTRHPRTREAAWLRERCADYQALAQQWADVCVARGIKVYLTWFKYDESHCAIADAVQRLGGITAVYQRSHESYPGAHTTVAADCFFGFSQGGAETERRSHSRIPYYVATGYLGDHRFPLLRESAARVRQMLQRRGAQRILAFADENTQADAYWYEGHEVMRRQYAFLLEKVCEEPWLGLVVKPKMPSTLRRRLGPVAALLTRAEATGRCIIHEEGIRHGSLPPAAAALAADVMVHGDVHAATAGLESALAGVPTLLLDREGWPASPLYRLGVGRVVFADWDSAWKGCMEHWTQPDGVPGFGDWSPLLEEFDPFRDGRAAERMGTYVQWLLEGFRAGLARQTVLADAAERYAARWGKDKITSVNCDPAIIANHLERVVMG